MPFCTLDRDGGIVHLRLSRPDLANALTPDFWRELPKIMDQCAQDPTVRVMVLSGDGRHFCSGMHLESFERMGLGREAIDPSRWRANFAQNLLGAQAALTSLEKARFPVIAAVHGACLGAAVDLLCACDIRYAARDARFAVSETNIGMTPDGGTIPRLQRLVPEPIARELVFSGRTMDAAEAERVFFVNRLFDDAAQALAGAFDLARQIAAKSPMAVWGSKETMNYARDHSDDDTLRYIAAWQSGMFGFEDIERSIAAQQARAEPSHPDVHLTADLFAGPGPVR